MQDAALAGAEACDRLASAHQIDQAWLRAQITIEGDLVGRLDARV